MQWRRIHGLFTVPYCSRRKIVGIEHLPLRTAILVSEIPVLSCGWVSNIHSPLFFPKIVGIEDCKQSNAFNAWKACAQQLQYQVISKCNNMCYYSFKIFSRFWLATSTRIIHHNQLLVTKFGRILRLINRWRQKCSFLAGSCSSCSEERSPMVCFPDPKQY